MEGSPALTKNTEDNPEKQNVTPGQVLEQTIPNQDKGSDVNTTSDTQPVSTRSSSQVDLVDKGTTKAKAEDRSKPVTKALDGSKPDLKATDSSKPNTKSEDKSKPDTKAEDGSKPDTKAEDRSKPDTKAEDRSKSEVKAEDRSKPDTKAENRSKPDKVIETSSCVDTEDKNKTANSGELKEINKKTVTPDDRASKENKADDNHTKPVDDENTAEPQSGKADVKFPKDEDTDSNGKDTDPLLKKSDSQKTFQSDTGSSVKSDSSSDSKKPGTDGKKKYSYIPIAARDKISLKDKKRTDSKANLNVDKENANPSGKNNRGNVTGSTQGIAMKGINEATDTSAKQGETTFSVVSEVKEKTTTKNVKWKENELPNKDQKAPAGKKESRIPELDKSKQNTLQTSLKRENAVLSNGSVKPVENENVQKTETHVPIKEEISQDKQKKAEEKKEDKFKPKSILARAIMKKVKEGSGQGQEKVTADPKHVVLNGPPAAVKTPSKISLAVPSPVPPVPRDPVDDRDERLSLSSRRDSTRLSLSDSMSRKSVDIRVANATTVIIPSSGQDDEKPKSLVSSNDSWIRSAIPFLPLSLAVFCLILNIFIPGSGTIVSGLAILCCGKARVQTKDDHVPITLCMNVWVGVAQLFTVTFLLVGWFWSLAWGIKMVILSIEYRKELKQKREKELQALALSAFGSPTRGRRSLFG